MKNPSNYPPGVTGNEPQIAGCDDDGEPRVWIPGHWCHGPCLPPDEHATDDYETALGDQLADLTDLVRWLDRTYGDNSPIFAVADWTGAPLDDGLRLKAVYDSLFPEKLDPAPHVAWSSCPTCGLWQTIPVEP